MPAALVAASFSASNFGFCSAVGCVERSSRSTMRSPKRPLVRSHMRAIRSRIISGPIRCSRSPKPAASALAALLPAEFAAPAPAALLACRIIVAFGALLRLRRHRLIAGQNLLREGGDRNGCGDCQRGEHRLLQHGGVLLLGGKRGLIVGKTRGDARLVARFAHTACAPGRVATRARYAARPWRNEGAMHSGASPVH